MTGMVAGVDCIGLLLAERLRRERGAGATARLPSAAARIDLDERSGFRVCHTRFGSFILSSLDQLEPARGARRG